MTPAFTIGLCVLAFAGQATAAVPPPDDLPRVLSLDEAVSIAKLHQPQLRQARAQSEAAAARTDEARAPLLPSVNASAGYTGYKTYPDGSNTLGTGGTGGAMGTGGASGAGTTSGGALTSQFTAGVNGNQLLYDFGQTTSRWHQAQATQESQHQTELATGLTVVLNVRSAFLNARANKALLAVARETLDNQNRHLSQVQAFVEVGTRPEIDLAQARSDQATAELQLIKADSGYAIAKAQLRQAMGINGRADFDITDETMAAIPGEDGDPDALLDRALTARPEFRALDEQLRAQELSIRSTRGGFGPSLGVIAGANYRAPNLDRDRDSLTLSAGLALTWPLLEGGGRQATLREGAATLDNLRATVDIVRQQVAVEVEQARLAMTSSKGAIVAAEKALVNARQRLRLAEARYQTGVGNALELSDAQLAVTNAGVQMLQAEFQLGTARAQLLKALGNN